MAISTSLRNRIVGFTIVASTILIFLPVILSKDMIKRDAPDNSAIAINQNGAVVDDNGNLQHQPLPNNAQAFNFGNRNGQLSIAGNPNSQPSLQANKPVPADNGVEILEAPRQGAQPPSALGPAPLPTAQNRPNNASTRPQTEVLEAKPKPQQQKKPEVLVANNNNSKPAATTTASTPEKPAPRPAATTNANKSSSDSPKVIAGTKPKEKYVIQVGVFSKRTNADNVINKITKAGISVYAVQTSSNNGQPLFRIYAGRANARSDLQAQSARIDKLCGTKSKIVAL